MTHIIVTLAYLVFLTGIIIYKSLAVKTQEDFVVAGRGVPVYLLVGTLVCTWIGSGSLFGTAGLTFRSGFSELWFSMGAWFGIIVIYFIAARVRAISKYTLTDLLEARYNKTARILGTITIIVAYLVIAGYQFKGGGRFISILTEGAISPEAGTLITCLLIITFTAVAGMVSIVSIDIFNGIIMLLAIALALPLAVNSHGGWEQVVDTVQQTSPEYLSLTEGHSVTWAVGIMLPTLLLLLSESSIYQKFSSAKDAPSARKAVMGMLTGVVIIEALMCTLAVVGYAIYADDSRFFLSDGSIDRTMSEEIILRIGYEQLPAYAGSLIFAAGVAIILSTGNTFLMVASTNVTRDLLQHLFGNIVEAKFILTQRVSIVALGALAYVLVSQFTTILEMAFLSYTMIGAAIAPVLMAAFFWKRVTPAGGVAAIVAGMIVPVINKALESFEVGFWLFPMDTDYISIPSLAISTALLISISLMTKPSPESKWKPFFE